MEGREDEEGWQRGRERNAEENDIRSGTRNKERKRARGSPLTEDKNENDYERTET